MIPLFILPARLVGRRMQRLTRESMQLNAEMGSTMTERFNVAGAMLVKLFGRPREESEAFAARAARCATSASSRPCTARCSSSRSRCWPRW